MAASLVSAAGVNNSTPAPPRLPPWPCLRSPCRRTRTQKHKQIVISIMCSTWQFGGQRGEKLSSVLRIQAHSILKTSVRCWDWVCSLSLLAHINRPTRLARQVDAHKRITSYCHVIGQIPMCIDTQLISTYECEQWLELENYSIRGAKTVVKQKLLWMN